MHVFLSEHRSITPRGTQTGALLKGWNKLNSPLSQLLLLLIDFVRSLIRVLNH